MKIYGFQYASIGIKSPRKTSDICAIGVIRGSLSDPMIKKIKQIRGSLSDPMIKKIKQIRGL